MRLILASASPRRAELLSAAGFEFDVIPADVDETPRAGESAETYTLRVARDKARRVAGSVGDPAVAVLGADTEVVAGGRILGKPTTPDDAARMLSLLSGRAHDVLTAVVVCADGRELAQVVTTRVEFTPMSEAEISSYVATGEPMGKAGAYAIQGYAARFIVRIDGSWSNVVGLPVHAVHRLLSQVREPPPGGRVDHVLPDTVVLGGRHSPNPMKTKALKIAATVVVLAGAFGGLMYTSLAEGTEYYKHVEEVMANPDEWHGKKLQLHGFVVDKSILRKPDTLEYRFQIQNKGHVVNASYTGVVPDTFKGGSEVVLKGRLGPHGFEVNPHDGVMAKCPSKYEAPGLVPTKPKKDRGGEVGPATRGT